MKLVELFDKPYPIRWDKSDPKDVTANFRTSSGNMVLINFIHLAHEVMEINFMMEVEDPKTGFVSRTFDATGTGDAPRIFATVVGAIQDYISDREPDYIWFSAKEKEASRIRLYDAMIKRATTGMSCCPATDGASCQIMWKDWCSCRAAGSEAGCSEIVG
jgi:hypothetical protein